MGRVSGFRCNSAVLISSRASHFEYLIAVHHLEFMLLVVLLSNSPHFFLLTSRSLWCFDILKCFLFHQLNRQNLHLALSHKHLMYAHRQCSTSHNEIKAMKLCASWHNARIDMKEIRIFLCCWKRWMWGEKSDASQKIMSLADWITPMCSVSVHKYTA